MKKRLPPLNWLRSFEASARHLSFTHAAAEVNLTQASISQQVRALENQLGVYLFKRLPRGLELTDAGMAYLPAVHEGIERLILATDEIFGQKDSIRRLSIKANLVFLTHWLAPRLGAFREKHPEVGLSFTSNIWVNEREFEDDLEIRYGKGEWKGLRSIRLTWDDLIPVCGSKLDSELALPKSPDDLDKHTLLHVLGYEEGWGYWLNKSGYSNIDSSRGVQMDTLISALKMASLGQGIALGRSSIVAQELENGSLVAPFKERIPTSEAFYLVYSESRYQHPYATIFRNWLVDEAERFRDQSKALV